MNTLSTKRSREQEINPEASSQSTSSSPNLTPTTKALRVSRAGAAPLLCTLPPTCHPPHNAPTALEDSQELEAHYAKYHAHVCEERGCAAVFPNARLLELHQTECHDPLALLRKERGEKIFACHLESCSRKFLDPKKRRLHLIQAHGFPKEYFFAVTNKGVGGLLKTWGEGASMIRGSWKPRDGQENGYGEGDMDIEGDENSDSDDGSVDEEMLSTGTVKDMTVKPSSAPMRQAANESKKASNTEPTRRMAAAPNSSHALDDGLDGLTNSLDSLSLVPKSVRFGRGGKSGRVVREAQTGFKIDQTSRHHSQINASTKPSGSSMDVEAYTQSSDPDVSINIDGALEALKSEAPSNSSAKFIARTGGVGNNHVPVLGGGRGRGGRGRGRGRGRGQGAYRGRG